MQSKIRAFAATLLLAIFCLAGGCASYTTPGRGADLSQVGLSEEARRNLSDPMVRSTLETKPLAAFPTAIAVARIQATNYSSRTASSWGAGKYSVVLTRDVEKEEQFARLGKLPMVSGIAPMNRLILCTDLRDDLQLREAAARLHADMLLIYTFDTTFHDNQIAQPLNVVSLGISPTKTVKVATTASAILVDTRNNYLYGLAEATASRAKVTNAWMTGDTIDDARRKNEEEAFEKLIGEIEKTWTGVVNQYAHRSARDDRQNGANGGRVDASALEKR